MGCALHVQGGYKKDFTVDLPGYLFLRNVRPWNAFEQAEMILHAGGVRSDHCQQSHEGRASSRALTFSTSYKQR
jgi:hypothetical protein